MKCTPILLLALLIGCTNPPKSFPPATNSIEAGRNYVEACLQGDFEKAATFNRGVFIIIPLIAGLILYDFFQFKNKRLPLLLSKKQNT